MARSKIFNALGEFTQGMIDEACAEMSQKADDIKHSIAMIESEIAGGAEVVKKGVFGATEEAYNFLYDVTNYLGSGAAAIQGRVDQSKLLLNNAKTVVDANPLNDPALQHAIIQSLTIAMADAQAALDAALDESQKESLLLQFQSHEASIVLFGEQVKQGVVESAATIKMNVARIKAPIYDAWKAQLEASSSSGSAGTYYPASALKGAKNAMNDKYGEGSVVW